MPAISRHSAASPGDLGRCNGNEAVQYRLGLWRVNPELEPFCSSGTPSHKTGAVVQSSVSRTTSIFVALEYVLIGRFWYGRTLPGPLAHICVSMGHSWSPLLRQPNDRAKIVAYSTALLLSIHSLIRAGFYVTRLGERQAIAYSPCHLTCSVLVAPFHNDCWCKSRHLSHH